MAVRTYLYDAEGKDRELELNECMVADLGERQLLWLDVKGSDKGEMEQAAKLLGLEPETALKLVESHKHPQLENYGHYLHLKVLGVSEAESHYVPVHLDLVAGRNFVMTAQHEDVRLLEDFNEQIRGDSDIGQLTSVAFMASLLDVLIDSYFTALDGLEDEIDRFDERALRRKSTDRDLLPSLINLRRRVSNLRRLLAPHRAVFARLTRPDFTTFLQDNAATHLDFLNERLSRAIDAVENARDMIIGSFDVLMTQTSQYTNETMKLLTIVTVSIGVAGIIAGLLGTNFQDVVFFQLGTAGFLGTIGLVLVIVIGSLALARFKRWI